MKKSEEDPDYDDSARPIWEEVLEIGASVPPEEWAKVPTDLSINLHHYLYGAPLVSFIGKGKGCFADAAEIDSFLRLERETWDR